MKSKKTLNKKKENKTNLITKKNCSYQAVLKSLQVLKHQLKKANNDVQTLNKVKEEALQDPYTFISNLKKVCNSFFFFFQM